MQSAKFLFTDDTSIPLFRHYADADLKSCAAISSSPKFSVFSLTGSLATRYLFRELPTRHPKLMRSGSQIIQESFFFTNDDRIV